MDEDTGPAVFDTFPIVESSERIVSGAYIQRPLYVHATLSPSIVLCCRARESVRSTAVAAVRDAHAVVKQGGNDRDTPPVLELAVPVDDSVCDK